MPLQIISDKLLKEFLEKIPKGLVGAFKNLCEAEISTDNFSFYTSVASVFSSKIEGEDIELDSYIKHKRDGISFQPDYTKKVDDLYDAYVFAKTNELNRINIEKAHQQLSRNLLPEKWQGKLRNQKMYVATDDGRIEYVAASPFALVEEMDKFYSDLKILINRKLSLEEVFYYASMIHLVFVKIHPWNDGNGRCGRLIEKWFLAQKLGEQAWFMEAEKNYFLNHQTYYANLRVLGLEYEELDYSKALPFLLMLPQSI